MKNLFDTHENIVAYTDGASIANPGESGVGIAFFSQEFVKTPDEDAQFDFMFSDDELLLDG